MARGRMISKDISLDEKVDALSDDTARLLFTWMIPHLDCEGRIYGDAKIFKSIVAPRRNYSTQRVEKYLKEMENLGLIVRYFADENSKNRNVLPIKVQKNQFLFAPNFDKHQVGLRKDKEIKSKIPPMDGNRTEIGRSEDGISPPQKKRSLSLKEKKFKDNNPPIVPPAESLASLNIFSFYEENIGDLTPMISEELKAAGKEFGADEIIKAIKEACRANKKSWRYIAGILENWRKGLRKGQRDYSKQKHSDVVCQTREDVEIVKKIREEDNKSPPK